MSSVTARERRNSVSSSRQWPSWTHVAAEDAATAAAAAASAARHGLCRTKDIATYVSIFAIGHSVTMVAGVWWSISINAYIIDAIIAFSVVYKALDNLGAFRLWFGVQPNTKAATLVFGLLHGFGLATKIRTTTSRPTAFWAT